MSASREKKERKETVLTQGIQDSGKGKNEDRNFYIMCVAIIVALAVAFVLCSLYGNEGFRKSLPAASVGGKSYSAADLDFYYYSNLAQMSSYLSMFGVDTNQDLDAQEYMDGQSWGDYLREQAAEQLHHTAAMYDAAIADGYEISDDVQSQIDTMTKSLEDASEQYGISKDDVLRQSYGSSMTEEIFMKHLKMIFVSEEYASDYRENHTYTDAEIDAYYDAHKRDIDWATYEVLSVNPDYEGIEAAEDGSYTAAQDKQARDAALEKAAGFVTRVKDGEALADIGAEYGEEYYFVNENSYYSTFEGGEYSAVAEWAFDEGRKSGDVDLLANEENGRYYIVVFKERSRPGYNTIDVRHILIEPEDTGLTSEDEGYEAAQTAAKEKAKQRADALLAQYRAGARTEDAFAELAKANTADGNGEQGGLYTQVYRGQMETAFNDWCFDEARKAGDTGVVETTYGYHVMYFVGENIPYWKLRTTNTMKTQWEDDIYNNAKVNKNIFGMKSVG